MPSRLSVVLVSLLLALPVVVFWLWLVFLPAKVAMLCPEECRCDTGGYNVKCVGSSLTSVPLIHLADVRELVLSGNNITLFQRDSFASLTELEGLRVLYCGLRSIELGAFNGLTKLTELFITDNEISEIKPGTFKNLYNLEYLGLYRNRIEHLDSDVFSGLVKLIQIQLFKNKLLYLQPDTFLRLPNLQLLYLFDNWALQIPTDRNFINSHSLTRLDISGCNVSSVSVETFANVSSMEWLDLSNNNLRTVDINILRALPKLSTLYLYGNPLQCDCQLQKVWQWCKDRNIQTLYVKCDTPREVEGMWWRVLEKGNCLDGNIQYYEDYRNKSYSYDDIDDTYNDRETDTHNNTETDTYKDTETDTYNATETDTYNDKETDTHNDTETDTYNDTETDTYNDTETNTHNDTKTDTYNVRESDTYSDTGTDTYNDTKTDTYNVRESDTYSDTGTDTYNDRESDTYSDTKTSTYNDRESDKYNGTETDTYNDRQSDTYSDTETDTYNDRESDTYSDTETDTYQYYDTYSDTINSELITDYQVLLFALPFVFGITSNVIILIIIICNKDMRTLPNMYIINLAISDIIYLTVLFSEVFVNKILDMWVYDGFMCTLLPFCRRLSVGLSAYSIAVLSLQRYRVTVNPIHVRVSSQPTWRATFVTICGVWIVAALFAVPSAVSKYLCTDDMLFGSTMYYRRVVIFEILVSCVLPLCVIAFCYIITARHLVKSSCPLSEGTKNPQLKTRRNTAKIVVGLTVVFLISYVPYHVFWTYITCTSQLNAYSKKITDILEYSSDEVQYTYLISTCFLLVNSCLNPVALFCTSCPFRQHLKRCLICFCKTNSHPSALEITRRN